MKKKKAKTEKLVDELNSNLKRGFSGFRDDITGLTPRQLLDFRKAQLAEIELLQKKGELVKIAEVEEGLKEAAEVIQSDLYGTLISRLVGEFSNKKHAPQEVREKAKVILDEIVDGWIAGGIVKNEKTA